MVIVRWTVLSDGLIIFYILTSQSSGRQVIVLPVIKFGHY